MDGRVVNLKTVKSCENFARNSVKRNFLELADQAWLRAAELRREEYQRGGRRPDVDYHIIGLKNGATIYLPDVDVKATIASHRTLFYKGREIYITPLEKELIEGGLPANKVRAKWCAELSGENIGDLYEGIYPKERRS